MSPLFKKTTFGFILFFTFNAWASQFGTFMLVKGRVFVESGSGERVEAKVNSRVYEGQTVITEVNSRAKIVMSDRNVIIVQPETRLKIEKYKSDAKNRNAAFNLIEGKIRTNVQQDYDMEAYKFEVKTSTAVAGVRGTQFITSYDPKSGVTEITTIEGKVEMRILGSGGFENSQKIILSAGEKVSASDSGKVGQVEKISNDEIKEIEKSSDLKDEDKRSQLNQRRNDDGAVVGGINNDPLRPKNNLSVEPRDDGIISPVNQRPEVKVIIGN